jgi:hypothetical protein
MAARTRRILHDDATRERIQATQLVNRLQDNALGKLKVEMTPGQVRSAEILLRKKIPDLSSTENKTEVVHRYVARLPNKATNSTTWQQQNAPKNLTIQ